MYQGTPCRRLTDIEREQDSPGAEHTRLEIDPLAHSQASVALSPIASDPSATAVFVSVHATEGQTAGYQLVAISWPIIN